MNYPESIYNRYEIIEKDIYGEKHYCLVRIYSIFGFTFRRKVQVSRHGFISSISGNRWHISKSVLEEAIRFDNGCQELRFREKVTK